MFIDDCLWVFEDLIWKVLWVLSYGPKEGNTGVEGGHSNLMGCIMKKVSAVENYETDFLKA